MAVRLEHANLCVRDMEAMIRFLQTAFPEFRQRGDGMGSDGRGWVGGRLLLWRQRKHPPGLKPIV